MKVNCHKKYEASTGLLGPTLSVLCDGIDEKAQKLKIDFGQKI